MTRRRKRSRLALCEARRLAIAAQGLSATRSNALNARDLRRTIKRLGLLQIDSVNVLVRAHYLPLFSRLGTYETTMLDNEAYRGKRRSLFEYWGHECSLIPVAMQPQFRWRMAAAERGEGLYQELVNFARAHSRLLSNVIREIEVSGPRAASDLECAGRSASGWWEWGEAKQALEWLFWTGRVTTASRRKAGFARVYDLTERVLPASILEKATPERQEAQRVLMRHAVNALGVATETDLRDYFRLPTQDAKARIEELLEAGEILRVDISDWPRPAFISSRRTVPRQVQARALLAPFDPLIWDRDRTERLFRFRYRLEIYTPASKRIHGYYVLPFLLGDRLVARVCLKADRQTQQLRVNSTHLEAAEDKGIVAQALAQELFLMAHWLNLAMVATPNGVLCEQTQNEKLVEQLSATVICH